MLIDHLVGYCDKCYTDYDIACGCKACTHPCGECSGNCADCADQLMNADDPKGRRRLDCPKLLDYYVCRFSYPFASEILNVFRERKDLMNTMSGYRMLSLDCGFCPELMAIEHFAKEQGLKKKVAFYGFDTRPMWASVQAEIKKYCDKASVSRSFFAKDIDTAFTGEMSQKPNIIVLNYLLSELHDDGREKSVEPMLKRMLDTMVSARKKSDPMLILFNDKNDEYIRGQWKTLEKFFKKALPGAKIDYRYFDTENLTKHEKPGTAYPNNRCLIQIPAQTMTKYHLFDIHNRRTCQMIITLPAE